MEQQTEQKRDFTKVSEGSQANGKPVTEGKVSITTQEAMEYREYKRQKKRAEILSAISVSEGVLTGVSEPKSICDRAVRLRQSAVQMTLERLEQSWEIFRQRSMNVDCLIGGNGETLAKVKAYEAKAALKFRAKEITVTLSPYLVTNCYYSEIRKEIKKLRKTVGKATLKVRVDKAYPKAVLSKLAKAVGECGAGYFCVPYYAGCEALRTELSGGCKLQVSGVETLADYKKLVHSGVGRIVTERALEMHAEWMKEVEKINFPELLVPENRLAALNLKAATENKQEKKPNPSSVPLALPAPALKTENEGKGLKIS